MPATLREAAFVARDLGIRYLWIDALCILQGGSDDLEAQLDWKLESSRMNLVYGNAYITIVATASSDCGSGLIPRSPGGEALKLSSRVKDKYCGTGVIDFGCEPLFGRGWAHQEWLLSARLLAFTSVGMQFFCDVWTVRSTHACHSFRLPRSRNQFDARDWIKVIIDFCGRNLTEPRDKLPAISGLAKRFSEIANGALGDYLAGLWRARLPHDLTWKRCPEAAMHFPQTTNSGRSYIDKSTRAPSWSWAAIDGPIRLAAYEKMLATVLSCTTEPAPGHDEFGEVLSGTLVLRCPYTAVHVAQETPSRPILVNAAGKTCPFWPDDDSEAEKLAQTSIAGESSVYSLGVSSSSDSTEYMGLVVNADQQTGDCIRIGCFWASRADFCDFDALDKKAFTIV
ncbi:HET-domain-containing protein [Thozetella sp. PMI_491]|nr:HET-domain-containing protein [Thozetella sp. PMI_491]